MSFARALPAAALAALVVLAVAPAHATDVTGAINANTSWSLAGSPYRLTGDVTVQTGVTLTIAAGVEVRAVGNRLFTVNGTLTANGSAAAPIVFRGDAASPAAGAWQGVNLASGSVASLTYAEIRHAATAVRATTAAASPHTLANLSLIDYSSRGLDLAGGPFSLAQITGRTSATSAYGITATAATKVTLSGGRFTGGAYGVYANNTNLALDHVVFASTTSAAVSSYASSSGTYTLDVDYCTFWQNAVALSVYRSSSSSYNIEFGAQRSIFDSNGAIVSDASSSSYRVTFTRFKRNVYTGTTLTNGYSPNENVENLNWAPMLAAPATGDFAPTERSPARYYGPAVPAQTLGAIPYAGAPSPAGVHGFWYVDKTFAPDSVTDVAGDIIVARGVTMTLLPGAELRMATTDAMAGGKDRTKIELRVEGTLEADGTNSKPVRLTSAATTKTPGDWYGVVIASDTEAFNVSQVDLGYARRGVSLESNDHIVAGSHIHHCSDAGVFITGGTPNVEQVELSYNRLGLWVENATDLDLLDVDIHHSTEDAVYARNSTLTWAIGRVYDNAQRGIYADATSSGSYAVALEHLTIAHNGGHGLEVYRSSSSSYDLTTRLKNSAITHNGGAAVSDASSSSYRTTFYCDASDLWGNASRFSGAYVSGTDTCFSENPLYVDAAARNYAPTTHSPLRHLGVGGALVGAVEYGDVNGPHLMGWLWENFTFTKSGSPWPILGDLTVPPGVTVTFEPGARLEFVPNADGMGGGHVPAQAELRIQAGATALFDGSGEPIVLTSAALAPAPGDWFGLRVLDGATTVIDNAEVTWPTYGLWVGGPSAPTVTDTLFLYHKTSGVQASDVSSTPGLDVLACRIVGTGGGSTTGFSLYNANGRLRSSYVTHHQSGVYAARTSSGTSTAHIVNNTIVHHADGVYTYRSSSSSYGLTISVVNNVIAYNTGYAVIDASSVSYSVNDTVRNNDFWARSNVQGAFDVNAGNLSSDPMIEDDDWDAFPRWWDGKLWSESPAINAGYAAATALPTRDLLGKARNLGGAVDIGAFEFDSAANREPRADAVTASLIVPRGEAFALNGSGALDPDGFIASAYWTMSDGTITAGQSVTHTFAQAGDTQWAYLTVIDDDGAEDHALVKVNVDMRPIADAGPAVFQDEGPAEEVFFDGTLSTDPDGTVVAWSWDFGDGSPVSTQKSPRHSYLSAGLYTVTLTVTDNEGLTATDTTLATVYGNVDTVGPLIQHVEIADGVPIATAVTVTADIRDPSGVASAYLFYRPIGGSTAKFAALVRAGQTDLWSASIPAADVTAAGVAYWFVAVDANANSNSSTAPPGAPDADVFDFLVVGDPNPPVINHTEIANGQVPGQPVTVSALITDATGVASANLYFRPSGGTSFGAAPMSKLAGNTWSAQIPAFVVASPGVEYYLEAKDSSPIPNTGYAPATAPTALFDFTVGSGDTTPPLIAHTPVVDGRPAGSAVTITASAADNKAVTAVTLRYRATGSAAAFSTVALAPAGGSNWSGAIPSAAVTTAGVDYYLVAADEAGNTAASPETAPTAWHDFTVIAVDTQAPTITHTPIADGRPAGQSVPVTATITDASGVTAAKLFYRPVGFPIFQEVTLSGSAPTFTGSIPSFVVAAPAVEYYLRATDGAGNTGTAPAAGASGPYRFTVADTSDTTPPTLAHDPPAGPVLAGATVSLAATASDASGLANVTVHYRRVGTATFTTTPMTAGTGGAYTFTFPTAVVAAPGVEYYLVATDASTNANTTTRPAGGATSPYAFDVTAPDTTAPTIAHTPVTTLAAGAPFAVSATVTDNVAVTAATLHWAADGGAFAAVALTPGANSTFTGTVPAASIPAAAVSLRYYLTAADAAGNTASDASSAAPRVVTILYPDTTAPIIVHTPVTSLAAGASFTVSATVTDNVAVTAATLRWAADGGAFATVALTPGANNTFTATVPAASIPAAAVSLRYYLTATDAAGNTASDGTSSAPRVVTINYPDTTAPVIVHTPVTTLAAGASFAVSATVTDNVAVTSATLRWAADGGAFATVALTPGANNTFTATVPAASIPAAAVSLRYYLTAADAAGNTASDGTSSAPRVVTINYPDTTAPTVVLTTVPNGQAAGVSVTVSAAITDNVAVTGATLHYRKSDATGAFATAPMSATAGVYSAVVPAAAVVAPGVAYYVSATDAAGHTGYGPSGAPGTPATFTVTAADTAGPTLAHTTPAGPLTAGGSVTLAVTASDASGVATVRLQWRSAGAAAFTIVPLSGVAGVYSTTLSNLSGTGIEYWFDATDTKSNASKLPAAAPTDVYAATIVTPDTSGPTIAHEPVANGRPVGASVAIEATLTDPSGVASATIHYRALGATGAFASAPLASAGGSAWAGVIPGSAVQPPGVEYYLRAADQAAAANAATAPEGAPPAVFAFTVGARPTDTTPPALGHQPVSAPQTAGHAVALSATASDASGVASVTAYFRAQGGDGTWLSVALVGSGGTWSGSIPALAVVSPGVEYYLEATDASPAQNRAQSPSGAPATAHAFAVVTPDTMGPALTLEPVASPVVAGTPIPVAVLAADAAGVSFCDLYYRRGSGAWATVPMAAGAAGRWAAVIPGADVTVGTVSIYVMAEDALGNGATAPADGPLGPLVVTVEAAPPVDVTGPTILHSPVSVVAYGVAAPIEALVTDASGVAGVTVHFREGGTSGFASVALSDAGGDRWTGEIPGFATRGATVEYYLEATDDAAAANKAAHPAAAPVELHVIDVLGQIADEGPGDDVVAADTVTPVDTAVGDDDTGSDAGTDVGADTAPTGGGSDDGCAGGSAGRGLGLAFALAAVALLAGRRRRLRRV